MSGAGSRRERRQEKRRRYGGLWKSRSKRCGVCPYAGRDVPPGKSCKVHRLCKRYDLTLRDLFPDRSDEEYEELGRATDVGHVRAWTTIFATMDANEDAFLDLVRLVHKTVFGEAYGDLAGRFRRPGEPVYVGHMHHQFEGADPTEIEARLRSLRRATAGLKDAPSTLEQLPTLDPSSMGFPRWAAVFLQGYLAIHPFIDGNGRTGRLLVEMAARDCGLVIALPFSHVPKVRKKDRDRYLYALQHAHKHLGVSGAAYREVPRALPGSEKDAYLPLERWYSDRTFSEADILEEFYDPWADDDDASPDDHVDFDPAEFVDDGDGDDDIDDGSDRF